MATAPLGKRPRGIQASPDGKSLYVALSGSPPAGPGVDPKTLPPPDRNADGIGEVDADTYKLKRIIHAGADPEQLAVSADGTRLYVANEDTETLSVVDVASGKVIAAVKVGEEPEGVTIRPDGKVVYVTSEGDGAVFAIDTADQQIAQADPGRAAAAVDRVPARRLARLRLAGEPGRDRGVRRQGAEVPAADHARGPGQHAEAAADGHHRSAPDGSTVYVTAGSFGHLFFIDPAKNAQTGSFEVGQRPWGIALMPGGKTAYTANGPSNDVSLVDLATKQVVKKIPVGNRPWGVAIISRR